MVDRNVLNSSEPDLLPFLKWPGGKRWLTQYVLSEFPEITEISGTYYEPFLGGGAMFFALNPRRAVLNDLNRELIDVYRVIRDDAGYIERMLRRYQELHSKKFYYSIRREAPVPRPKAAARFLYLNRTCWNGLFRVNLRGEFNVPIGTKTAVVLPSDNFAEVARRLRKATLTSRDFAAVISTAKAGDVIFADPPYTVNHNSNGFLKYNEQLFSWSDQLRLKEAALDAVRRGAQVILSNADHSSIRELYSDGNFTLRTVDRFSKLSGSNASRRKISELVITSIPRAPKRGIRISQRSEATH